MSQDAHQEHDGVGHHGVGHIVPLRVLFATGFALLVLTGLTVWSASIDFGEANIWIATVIAGLKASLVCLFFMHLRWSRPFNSFIFISSVVFAVLFIGLSITDTSESLPQVDKTDAKLVVDTIATIPAEEQH